jgi:copper homeostasis protein (lipoprotein)
MKNVLIAVMVVMLASCQTQKTASSIKTNKGMETADAAHTSQNVLDWDGTYRGFLPCADCEAIQTTVTLKKDLTFTSKTIYLGKSDSVYQTAGKFGWNENGNTITLTPADKSQTTQYLVGENLLTQLDTHGNKIADGNASRYVLSKSNFEILEKYWKLVELNGKDVVADSTFIKDPHIIFKGNNRIMGNGGCNSISGEYKIESLNRITFSKMISTKMACEQMGLESEFLESLQKADSFNVVGDMLMLSRARMAPLARFKAVYLK